MSARALEATPGHDSRGILAASGSGKRWMRAVAATEQHRLRLARYDCSNGVRWQRAAMDASCSGNRATQAQACTLQLQQWREVAASSGRRTASSEQRQQAVNASSSGNRATQAQACTLRLQQRRVVAASSCAASYWILAGGGSGRRAASSRRAVGSDRRAGNHKRRAVRAGGQ